jgi:N-methylhydantoinase A/oxoprolinase/acetone carboxylase beta subunit
VPLCQLAAEYPAVERRLRALARRTTANSGQDWLEYWFLVREPAPSDGPLDDRQRQLIDLLAERPTPVPDALRAVGALHRNQLGAKGLFRREILGKAGLTPTDLLHFDGRYSRWDVSAAAGAVQAFSRILWQEPDEVAARVWKRMTAAIVAAIVGFLTGQPIGEDMGTGHGLDSWFFENSLAQNHPHLATRFELRHPIIGIGAPAGILLPPVAEALHTELVLPDHFEVANAVGAVGGSVMVEEDLLIYPRLSVEGLDVIGYCVQDGDGLSTYDELEDALKQARDRGSERVRAAAIRAGAESPEVVVDQTVDGLDSYRLRIRAVGNPRLAGP